MITFIMYKISGGIVTLKFNLEAINDLHALTVASDYHKKMGLIGRYYCETSTGGAFQVS